MLRLAAITVVVVAALAPAAPRQKEKNETRSLVGTKWVGNSYEKQSMSFEFLDGGRVKVVYNGSPIEDAGWSQDGDRIHFHLNKRYCMFDGRVKGDRVLGECYNIADQRWEVILELQR